MGKTTVIEISPPRGYSAYEIAVQHGYEGTEAEWNAAVNAARIAAEQARDTVLGVKAGIDARFLPDAATDPSTAGLVGGELYYNTALNAYRYFNGTVFDYVTPDGDYLLL